MWTEKYFCVQKEKNMRNLKKILIVICVLSLLVVGLAVWAIADEAGEEENVGSVAELSALIATAEKESDITKKYQAILAVSEYLETKVMDPNEEGYDDCEIRMATVAVMTADMYLSKIPANVEGQSLTVDELSNIFMTAHELLNLFEVPQGTAGFSRVQVNYDTALLNLSRALTKDIGTDIANDPKPNTAANKIKLNRANSIITYCTPYGYNPELSEIKAEYEKCVAAHNQAVAKLLNDLDSVNDVSSYELPIYYQEDWENSKVGYDKNYLTGWSYTDNGALSNRVGIRQEPNGNKYYVHEYREQRAPAGSFIQRGLTGFNAEKGLVFEFSIGTFGEVPKEGILVETGSINGSFPPPYFYIDGKGNICTNDKKTVLLEGALVKGGWLDIIIALDPIDFVYKIYVEGQYIGSYDARLSGSTYDHSKVAFRLSGGASTQGEICYDNFKIYAGSNYRNHTKLEDMTAEEQFAYYVDYFTTGTNPILDRKNAYDKATAVVRNYCEIAVDSKEYTILDKYKDNEMVCAAVEGYMTFDIDTLLNSAMTANLDEFVSLVEQLRAVARSTDTVTTRRNKIEDINNFLKKNLSLMDTTADSYSANPQGSVGAKEPNGATDYDEYNLLFNKLCSQTEYDANSATFVSYINKFKKATTIAATERYYNLATNYLADDKIDLSLIKNESTPYRENFKELLSAYETYVNAHVKIDQVTKSSNAKKIVQCMNAINHYRTEEQWEMNRDDILLYTSIVKEYILVTDSEGQPLYDTNYEGVDEAVRFFHRVYSYFDVQLQNEHVAYITEILDLIAATDDYVEKIGLVALIDRYIDTNDVNVEDARVDLLLTNLATVRSELEYRGEDYSKILRQNSVYFINFVEKMRTATTYAEQVEYHAQAALLYFSLDTAVDGTWEAIDTFDEYDVKLDKIREASDNFLAAVLIYKACETEEDRYAALVDCYYNAQYAELTYEGVAEAMAEYQAAYDAYVSYANAVNSDITEAGNAVGSFRINCGITTIIAIIIKKIFGV